MQQDHAVVEIRDHLVGVGDEVGAQVATVELHAFDDIGLGLEALVLFDGDDTLVADLLHRIRDLTADFSFAIGGDGADLSDFGGVVHGTCGLADGFDNLGRREVDAALEVHRVHAGGNRLHAFLDDGLGQNRRGGGAVAGFVIGAGSDFLHHLGAHVLELVFQFDFLGDRNTVLGDAGRAERLVQNHVAALGAERDFDGVGEDVHTLEHARARIS